MKTFSTTFGGLAHVGRSAATGLRGGWLLALLLAMSAAHAQTTSFACTGGSQLYTVPAGVTQLAIVATGAYNGAVVQATVPVTPGETLTVVVGGTGAPSGPGGYNSATPYGYNGGGGTGSSGRGGGATDLRRTGTSTGDYLSSRNALLVAGGGGADGYSVQYDSYYVGGSGGTPNGGNGTAGAAGYAGVGATPAAVGAGAAGAAAGSANVGGAKTGFGGSGGGGYYGGGGGNSGGTGNRYGGGGGGGSSWVIAGSTSISYGTSGVFDSGAMTITPLITAPPVLTAPANGSTVVTATPTYTGTAPAGSTVRLYVDGSSTPIVTTATSGGTFSVAQTPALGQGSHSVYATAQTSGSAVSTSSATSTFTVLLPPTLSSVSPAAELPGTVVSLTGTYFTSGSTVSFGGTAASVTFVSTTSLTATVSAGLAAGSALVSVTTSGGTTATQPFTVLAVYSGGTVGSCTAAVPATASLNDGAWHYLLSSGGQVVAAYSYTGPSLGNLAVDVLRADPAQPVRQDPRNHAYLDRNWHLTASAGPFAGRSVGLRLYGLTSELTRLQAADAAATLAALKATQYSGPNEDCALANDVASAEHRTLAAPASTPAGTSWFVAELAVADHFSEFYLTGSATPLPVELTAFTVTAAGSAAVRLAWATASEKNSAAFEVERSADGTAFAIIGTVAAAGSSSSVRGYELLDARLPGGVASLYYRLKQLDQDGTASYSPVRVVTLSGKASLALYPNPAHGGLATLTGALPGTVATVFDALGRPITAAPADATGTAALVLPAGLPSGVYVVRAGTQALRLTVE